MAMFAPRATRNSTISDHMNSLTIYHGVAHYAVMRSATRMEIYQSRDSGMPVAVLSHKGDIMARAIERLCGDNRELIERKLVGIIAAHNAIVGFDCPLCGQHLSDSLPCGCGAR